MKLLSRTYTGSFVGVKNGAVQRTLHTPSPSPNSEASAMNTVRIASLIALTLVSCIVNVFFLEMLIGRNKNCSNLITFSGFLLISVDGFIFTSKAFTKKPSVPLRYNALLVAIFFITNVVNNLVFKYHVPMTLHLIFKSGSLLTSLVFGIILLKRQYPYSKYISVIAVTVGIILCTYASTITTLADAAIQKDGKEDSDFHLGEFIIGVSMLATTLLASSYMGILQERIAAQFGKHPRETLFYNHILPLPLFAFLYYDIAEQVKSFNESEPVEVFGCSLPYMWVLLACNTASQYCCINLVFQLTSECTSLTVTLIITIRKFLSLIVSIFYFGNPFTSLHWIGTVLVFGGSAIFADLHNLLLPKAKDLSKKSQ